MECIFNIFRGHRCLKCRAEQTRSPLIDEGGELLEEVLSDDRAVSSLKLERDRSRFEVALVMVWGRSKALPDFWSVAIAVMRGYLDSSR
ncbi:MAG: hypothetical protein J7641_17620 [Cyanobacteria bacterium SID2]|nr:hypothetical protein [Cyanobacteria bacterium SID2]MBP0003709.1 hypothetical protein [Cyanobacteria bacterium SBC]